jgi:hypothetical protein
MKTSVALTSAALLTIRLPHAQAPTSNARGSSFSPPRTPWNMLKVTRDAEKKPS